MSRATKRPFFVEAPNCPPRIVTASTVARAKKRFCQDREDCGKSVPGFITVTCRRAREDDIATRIESWEPELDIGVDP